jgi:SAM-dependent methyltransferase
MMTVGLQSYTNAMSTPIGTFERTQHWENIYSSKPFCEMSWYQDTPDQSLQLLKETGVATDASIVDIGGGDSLLVEHLLKEGYTRLSVLDISAKAIERAKLRLGTKAGNVQWICADMLNYEADTSVDVWHDRAAFHFLREEGEIKKYVDLAAKAVAPGGFLIIGTFADDGPEKCSGIEIKRYSVPELTTTFATSFRLLKAISHLHKTPSGKLQHFNFCLFHRAD